MRLPPSRFADRFEAGRLLGARLLAMQPERPAVYGLPRGGVPVALEVARALKAPLDLVLVRKIGAPGEPELALGAVVDGDPPQTVLNVGVSRLTGADEAFVEAERRRALAEIERRRSLYFQGRARVAPLGRTAIVVDDGLATGASAKAAVEAIRRLGAKRVILAIPVAPRESLKSLAALADDVVCLNPARGFYGVGQYYDDFHQLSDEETIGLLRRAWAEGAREF